MEGKADTDKSADRYVAHLAHELRTPLGAIMGYADAMRAGVFGPLDPRYADYAEIIHEAGRHMLAMAEDLLERVRLAEPVASNTRAPIDVSEPVAWALRLLKLEAEAAGVELRLERLPETPVIVADRRAIAQMVINLVANALRHTPRGGSVTVDLMTDSPDILMSVRDTGPGMAPGSEMAGRGLGLVRELVQSHEGAMTISSVPREGTTVTLRIPGGETSR